jgi:hypothetical protein
LCATCHQIHRGGAWVCFGHGWLTGRAQPESKETLKSWGADVVVSLQCTGEGGGIAHGIVAAVASARALAYHYVCPVSPTWRTDYSDEDCKQLARTVAVIDAHLRRGDKVAVLCRHGQALAIYVVLRLNGEAQEDSVSMMNTMRLMFRGVRLRVSDLVDTATRVLTNPTFIWEYAHELSVFCI